MAYAGIRLVLSCPLRELRSTHSRQVAQALGCQEPDIRRRVLHCSLERRPQNSGKFPSLARSVNEQQGILDRWCSLKPCLDRFCSGGCSELQKPERSENVACV